MSVVCSICFGNLTEMAPNAARMLHNDIACALPACGHVFHFTCIKQWFEGAGGIEMARTRAGQTGSCPLCKTVNKISKVLKVYLSTGSDGTGEAAEKLKDEIDYLKNELDVTNEAFEVLSKDAEAFKERVEELEELNQALEGSTHSALEELRRENRQLRKEHELLWQANSDLQQEGVRVHDLLLKSYANTAKLLSKNKN